MQQAVVKDNLSVDSMCSSDSNFSSSSTTTSSSSTATTSSSSSTWSRSSAKLACPRRTMKRTGLRAAKIAPDGGNSPKKDVPLKRCDPIWKLFDYFNPSSVAQFTEKKLLSLKENGNLLLSEPKLRAIAENAKQLLQWLGLLMQVAGIVNDHLVTCFRYQECNTNVKKNFDPVTEETKMVTEALENKFLSQ
ncbi:hypothetical protein GH714_005895 [Hevea brasiliensis]|uniref:Uncharacterized protein n=1 Tax=Hevea brasiliensis TaxID=3981 RepID=A0A6A6LEQ6_HEVBR|nr:hypothetical protein GH714_005895 [Hevea brasiliensis]